MQTAIPPRENKTVPMVARCEAAGDKETSPQDLEEKLGMDHSYKGQVVGWGYWREREKKSL